MQMMSTVRALNSFTAYVMGHVNLCLLLILTVNVHALIMTDII